MGHITTYLGSASNNIAIEDFRFLESYHSGHRKDNAFENLYAHSLDTYKFFKRFIKERHIKFNFVSLSDEKSNQLTEFLCKLIFLHDIGKINPYAQKCYSGTLKKSSKTRHAKLSFLIILWLFRDYFENLKNKALSVDNRTEKDIFSTYLLLFSYSIAFHHTNLYKYKVIEERNGLPIISLRDIIRNIFVERKDIFSEITEKCLGVEKIKEARSFFENYFNKDVLNSDEKRSLFFNIKLFYSLLVLSDYYATYAYTAGINIEKIKINQINKKLLEQMSKNFYSIPYNKGLINIDELKPLPLNQCNTINCLRNNLIIQATKTLRKSLKNDNPKTVYTLTVPTGGGKTNISIKLALEILQERLPEINRIFWVFPFINIIEQNYSVLKKTLFQNNGTLSEKNLSQIYSGSFNLNNDEIKDYETHKKEIFNKYFNTYFINNPINVISNVNFFNAFFKTKKDNRYKFSNFTNSIVILDEIQSLNSDYINIFYKILEDISKKYNIYFIVMSATLPNPSEYVGGNISIELIEDNSKYFKHRLFKRNELVVLEKKLEGLEALFDYCKEKIEGLSKRQKKILIVVNTIKTSIALFEMFQSNIGPDSKSTKKYDIYLMNSLINKEDRGRIIERIKTEENEGVILISTQSIEAGVDLNFDVGFRDCATVDSIEQVAGRINRECDESNAQLSKLYLFNFRDESTKVYNNDLRFKPFQDNNIKIKEIIQEKNFNLHYQKYFEEIRKQLKQARRLDYANEVSSLNYMRIHDDLNIITKYHELKIMPNTIDVESKRRYKEFLHKNKCGTISDLVQLKKQYSDISYKPLAKIIINMLNACAIGIPFFNSGDREKFNQFMNERGYIVKELNDNNIIASKSFYDTYLVSYWVKGTKFSYFDISTLLKRDFSEFCKSENDAIFV